jgi:hypothetical protein
MRKTIAQTNKLVAGLALALFVSAATSNAAVIASWGFEVITPADVSNSATNGPHNPDVGAGSASGVHASANTDWSTPVGNGSANAYSSNEWAIGDYYQFQVSTIGLTGQNLVFNQTRSSTGPADWSASYSTDGTTYSPLFNYTVPATTWSSVTPDNSFGTTFFSQLPGATDNQATVFIRLTAQSAPGGTAGTSRVDNVAIGDVVPEPAALSSLGLVALGLLRRRHD